MQAINSAPPFLLAGRIWMEALEPRVLLSQGFGLQGRSAVAFHDDGYAQPFAMAAAPGGKFYVAGHVGDGWNSDWGLARLNVDGTPDSSFGPNGNGTAILNYELFGSANPDRLLVQPDGKVLIVAESVGGLEITRVNAD